MRHSANLNVIIKAIERATAHIPRDFMELENLQTNPISAAKFANACCNRVKQILADDFSKLRPDYGIIFSDGQKLINGSNPEFFYSITAIDGLANLTRSNPDFTVSVALEHNNADGEKESISVAIKKILGGETYYCEKGFGAYLNSRRLRVSKRSVNEILVISTEDHAALEEIMAGKKFSPRAYGCRSLEVAYLAACRLEKALFTKQDYEFLKPLLLLVREAGGQISEEEKFILASA